jgi:hypothetical protein
VEKAAMASVKVETAAKSVAAASEMAKGICKREERVVVRPLPPCLSAVWPCIAALLPFWCTSQVVAEGLLKMLGVRAQAVVLVVLLVVALNSARIVGRTQLRRLVGVFQCSCVSGDRAVTRAAMTMESSSYRSDGNGS